jgi:hypothetical protein
LKKGYPAARPKSSSATSTASSTSSSGLEPPSNDRWLLQVLLLTPNVAAASLVKCAAVHPSTTPPGTTTTAIAATPTSTSDAGDRLPNYYYYYWPNWQFPAGLAKVDITDEEMPSSAYRKLMEALECMRIRPHAKCTVYDLGACPGGWTWILRHFLDCSVIAIDKSPVDPRLMKDPRIEFIKGDAFTFEPRPRTSTTTTSIVKEVWMVSDIIAYPDRILELLSRWCGGKWADCMVVTMKFHGSQPDLDAIDQAVQVAQIHGYHCRAKHFFNNKNEVTLMIRQHLQLPLKVDEDDSTTTSPPLLLQDGVLGTPMYPSVASSSTTEREK